MNERPHSNRHKLTGIVGALCAMYATATHIPPKHSHLPPMGHSHAGGKKHPKQRGKFIPKNRGR